VNQANYANTVRKIAWGYFFLYLDVNLNGWSILPAWFGWYKFGAAIGVLKEVRPKLGLLEGFAAALTVWRVVTWQPIFELPGWLAPVQVLFSVMEMFFHFHLLTELSTLTSGLLSQRILRCRTASVVLETALVLWTALPIPQTVMGWPSVLILLVQLFVCLYLMMSVFSLAKEMEDPQSAEI